MLWPKKNSYKELIFDNKKQFLQLENSPPPPPITFLMVRPLDILIDDTEYALQLDINLTMKTKIAQLNKIPNAANCTSPRVP